MASDTGRMSVAVDVEKQKKLDAIATREDRSRNWIVNRAIEQFLELDDWQTAKIRARLAAAESRTAVLHDSAAVNAVIEDFKQQD